MKKSFFKEMKFFAKRALFPGLDLHTRSRYRFLPYYFRAGAIDTLDAGFGNGALSYAAYKLGNRVTAVSNNYGDVMKARDFFSRRNTCSGSLRFEICDLYDLPNLIRKFDQIICSETLEHIKQDDVIVRNFYKVLNPNGILHLCCPFALHSRHKMDHSNGIENGGHVRDGYTLETYRNLLEPAGFNIVGYAGIGAPLICHLDIIIRRIRNLVSDIAALPVFLVTLPLQQLDYINPRIPFSVYVQAIKT